MTSKGKKLNIHLSDPIQLDGDFEGFSFVARLNVSMGTFGDLQSGNFDRIAQAWADIIYDWTFYDEEGDPFPSITEARELRKEQRKNGGWTLETDPVFLLTRRIPIDLTREMGKAYDREVGKLNPT